MKRRVLIAVQIAGTIVLAGVLFRRFDWSAFAGVLRSLTPSFYIGSLIAVGLGQMLFAWRWRVVLRAIGVIVPAADVLRQYLIGMFFSNLLPTAVGGDAVKVYYLGRSAGYAEAGASVLVDRILGFAWLAFIGAGLAWSVPAGSSLFELNRALLTGFAAGFVVLLSAARLVAIERIAPAWIRGRPWCDRVEKVLGFVRTGACRPAALAAGAVATIVYVTVITVLYQLFFRLAGVTPPAFAAVMLAVVSAGIFVNVPISVNGIGLREQLHYLLFSALGVPKEVAVSVSLLMFAHMLLLSLLGWAAWLRAHTAAAPVAPSPVA
jgi:uncharacterized protein (TIRG00374 family)